MSPSDCLGNGSTSLCLGQVPFSDLAALKMTTGLTDLRSANVWGLLGGSQPTLASEYIVLTAHLDHLGIGESVGGDAIYNGAVDNASGVAGLLATAQAFAALSAKPARSIPFVATTGEELGEIGSDYFVRHAPVPIASIVASFNIDGLSIAPFEDVAAAGGASSTLGNVAEHAGRQGNSSAERVDRNRRQRPFAVSRGCTWCCGSRPR
jgi:hypothetical protein